MSVDAARCPLGGRATRVMNRPEHKQGEKRTVQRLAAVAFGVVLIVVGSVLKRISDDWWWVIWSAVVGMGILYCPVGYVCETHIK